MSEFTPDVPKGNVCYRLGGMMMYGTPIDSVWSIILRIRGRRKYALDIVTNEEWVPCGNGHIKRKTFSTAVIFEATNKAAALDAVPGLLATLKSEQRALEFATT